MRGFRDIHEAQRPGNKSKDVKFSEETMKKYNSLFADDTAIRSAEFLAATMASKAAQKVSLALTENPEIKEGIDATCDALLSQPMIGGAER